MDRLIMNHHKRQYYIKNSPFGGWGAPGGLLIKEPRLLVLDAKFLVNCSHNTLNLTHSEHTAEESVARVVTMVALVEDATRLVGECHTVVNTHWETAT